MSDFRFLTDIQKQIEQINGQSNPFDSEHFVMPTQQQNALIVNQGQECSDVAICLQEALIKEFSERSYPEDFCWDEYPSLSILIEEISHFNYFCEMSHRRQEISPLDLEIQAEVDKFSFALKCLHHMDRAKEADRLFDLVFESNTLGAWVTPEEVEVYQDAHDIARAFCRRVLKEAKNYSEKEGFFQSFFLLSPEEKRRLAL